MGHYMGQMMRWTALIVASSVTTIYAWSPLAVTNDPLVRMPGNQPGSVALENPSACVSCHFTSAPSTPGTNWMGSMMAQAARDPLFWATMTVAAQDSIWALGTPNAADLCLRCHFPEGWLEGRSDPPNATLMTGSDYDGVHCTVCHSMMDPFYADTFAGIREGAEWTNYWDEIGSLPQTAASNAVVSDALVSAVLTFMNQSGFYTNNRPVSTAYTENASGQMFMNTSNGNAKRGPFADSPSAYHNVSYSRYHKSKFICSTCHDVSNPVLANLGADPTNPLPTEVHSAYAYAHVERTFSEFMLSAFGAQDGAPGAGAFAPEVFNTSHTDNWIASCQDCHMPDESGKACNNPQGVNRPSGSTAHPNSGAPSHDLTGGNAWIPRILASTVAGSPNYNATNRALLVTPGATNLTLNFTQGIGLNARALIGAAQRAENSLQRAASITNAAYNPVTGEATFRIVNHTGHKLITGYPEGRRMFANVVLYQNGQIIHEINPYDTNAATMKGLPLDYSPNSPALSAHESHHDALVYESKMSSSLTGEETTFHFVLGTSRYKDNRIPPRGFLYDVAGVRIAEPVWQGMSATNLFTPEEYAGGYREVNLTLPTDATQMLVRLYYQTTSREYIEFLRDEISGTNQTLTGLGVSNDPPYLVQSDPWFSQLKSWGTTIWALWENNKHQPGAKPILMTSAEVAATPVPEITWSIVSAHGTPQPSGVITQFTGFTVTGSVDQLLVEGTTQYVSAGWTLSGNEPGAGTGHTAIVTLTNDATLTWGWTTNFWLSVATNTYGTTSATGLWVAAGSTVSVSATAAEFYSFSHWIGDVAPGQELDNPIALLMDGAKTMAAMFAENLATNGAPEWWLAVYYPDTTNMNETSLSDSDLDGVQAWAEYIAGTNPTNTDSVLALHEVAPNGLAITWPSVSGRLYSVLYATNLAETFHPFPDALALPATPNFNAYTNLSVTNVPMLLYRIDVQREPSP